MASSEKQILCVGVCLLDYVHICPKPLDESKKHDFPNGHIQRGGTASNISTVISLIGGNIEFLGILTQAKGFEMLANDLMAKNINIEHCPRTDLDPGFSSTFLDQSTKNKITLTSLSKNFGHVTLNDLKELNLANYSWIHWEGKFVKETNKMIKYVYDYNKKSSDKKITLSVGLDFVGNDDNYYVGPDILDLTNFVDYVFMSKAFSQSQGWTNMKEAAFNLRDSITNRDVFIICFWNDLGAGMLFNNVFEVIDPYKSNIIKDPVGYTDAFIGGTIYLLALGTDFHDAIDFGNKVAAFKLEEYGFNHIKNVTR